MYNLQFSQAHAELPAVERQHPADPMGPASDAAAYLFSEFDRLHILQSEFFTHDQHFVTDHKLAPDPAVKQKFEAALAAAARAGRRAVRGPERRSSPRILASGLHSDYLALIEKRYAAALSGDEGGTRAGGAAAGHQSAVTTMPGWPVGVENYMLSIKAAPRALAAAPGAAPKPIAPWACEKLRLTAEKGHYLAPFARLLLARGRAAR